MVFDSLAIFPLFVFLISKLYSWFIGRKLSHFYIPSSKNIVLLKIEAILHFSLRFEINQTVRVYYKLVLYEEHEHSPIILNQ